MSRIVTALVLIPPLLAIIFFAPVWAFLLLAEVVALLAAREFFGVAECRGYSPYRMTGYLGAAFLIASFHPEVMETQWVMLLFLLGVAISALLRGKPGPTTLGESSVTMLGATYAGLLTGTIVGLRCTIPDPEGRYWVFFLLAVVMFGDAGAYYTGRAIGRRPLARTISPKKTVEGLAGGLISSVLVAALVGPRLLPGLDWIRASSLGLILAILGVFGDLFESLLKRSVGVKDASSLFPGHGGILDRLDSVLFAAPALLFYVHFLHP
jgi:phosphatidate cytidylyltransferase